MFELETQNYTLNLCTKFLPPPSVFNGGTILHSKQANKQNIEGVNENKGLVLLSQQWPYIHINLGVVGNLFFSIRAEFPYG